MSKPNDTYPPTHECSPVPQVRVSSCRRNPAQRSTSCHVDQRHAETDKDGSYASWLLGYQLLHTCFDIFTPHIQMRFCILC